MFAPTAATTLHGEGIDSVKNTVLLAHDVHSLMGSLILWLEATEVNDTYTVKTASEAIKTILMRRTKSPRRGKQGARPYPRPPVSLPSEGACRPVSGAPSVWCGRIYRPSDLGGSREDLGEGGSDFGGWFHRFGGVFYRERTNQR
jgi:hypothetical protein